VLGTRLARRLGARPGSIVRIVVPASIRPNPGQGGDDASAELDMSPRHGEFEVLGLLDTGFAEFDASFVLMHITAAQAIVFGQLRASGVEIELADAPRVGQALPVAKQLVAELERERSASGHPPLYRAASWAERSATLVSIRQTKALIVLILSLIIVVASGSLLGALLLLLRRERRHIGVLAGLGARPRQLFWVFELVGVGIGGLGAALGIAWGGVSLIALAALRLELDPDVYMIDHLPVAFVIGDVVLPSIVALIVCALMTGPVAVRVGRIRPIELVR
jgi:lipoprotein-releasing system permease protein